MNGFGNISAPMTFSFTATAACGIRRRWGGTGSDRGDFDSHEKPETDRETIVLPVKKDDTDTVFAAKEAMRRGSTNFCW